MSKTNIKSYTDKQLLDKVRLEPNFKGFPNKLWNVAIRSTEDANDSFDDKIYTCFCCYIYCRICTYSNYYAVYCI